MYGVDLLVAAAAVMTAIAASGYTRELFTPSAIMDMDTRLTAVDQTGVDALSRLRPDIANEILSTPRHRAVLLSLRPARINDRVGLDALMSVPIRGMIVGEDWAQRNPSNGILFNHSECILYGQHADGSGRSIDRRFPVIATIVPRGGYIDVLAATADDLRSLLEDLHQIREASTLTELTGERRRADATEGRDSEKQSVLSGLKRDVQSLKTPSRTLLEAARHIGFETRGVGRCRDIITARKASTFRNLSGIAHKSVECRDDEVISTLQLRTNGHESWWTARCCRVETDPSGRASLEVVQSSTPWTVTPGFEPIQLDRMVAGCPDGGMIQSLELKTRPRNAAPAPPAAAGSCTPVTVGRAIPAPDDAEDTTQWTYKCAKPQSTSPAMRMTASCVDRVNEWTIESGNPRYLDRQMAACPDGHGLSGLTLRRDYKGGWRYEYSCCKPGSEWRDPELERALRDGIPDVSPVVQRLRQKLQAY